MLHKMPALLTALILAFFVWTNSLGADDAISLRLEKGAPADDLRDADTMTLELNDGADVRPVHGRYWGYRPYYFGHGSSYYYGHGYRPYHHYPRYCYSYYYSPYVYGYGYYRPYYYYSPPAYYYSPPVYSYYYYPISDDGSGAVTTAELRIRPRILVEEPVAERSPVKQTNPYDAAPKGSSFAELRTTSAK